MDWWNEIGFRFLTKIIQFCLTITKLDRLPTTGIESLYGK
jgi:hypothetical protein